MPRKNRQPAKRPEARQGVSVTHRRTEVFSGPLPPPHFIEEYERILPGSFDRILRMAEKQADHRHELEQRAVRADARHQLFGVIGGFLLAALLIAGAIYLLAQGRRLDGFSVLGTVIGQVLGAFVYTRKRQARELQEKAARF